MGAPGKPATAEADRPAESPPGQAAQETTPAADTAEAELEQLEDLTGRLQALAGPLGYRVRLEKSPAAAAKGEPRRFRLTDRDIAILRVVGRYRYLRTGQIKRLLFPENTTKQSVLRRLRCLADPAWDYLRKIQPYVQAGRAAPETAYFLGRAGAELLEARGEPAPAYARGNPGRVRHLFLEHALELSEFRVNLELALRGTPSVALQRFTADFELKEQSAKGMGLKGYKLYHTVVDAPSRRSFEVYPDALIILRGTGEYASVQRLYFLEIDRGTERLEQVRQKILGYHCFREQGVFRKYGRFHQDRFRVLLQTSSPKRAANLRALLRGSDGEDLVLITAAEEVREDTILKQPVWERTDGRRFPLVT
jgi:hypothetical protein